MRLSLPPQTANSRQDVYAQGLPRLRCLHNRIKFLIRNVLSLFRDSITGGERGMLNKAHHYCKTAVAVWGSVGYYAILCTVYNFSL